MMKKIKKYKLPIGILLKELQLSLTGSLSLTDVLTIVFH